MADTQQDAVTCDLWRDVGLHVIEPDGSLFWSGLAGILHDQQADNADAQREIRDVAMGDLDQGLIGGGAAPLFTIKPASRAEQLGVDPAKWDHGTQADLDREGEPEDTSHERDTFVPHPDTAKEETRPLLARLSEFLSAAQIGLDPDITDLLEEAHDKLDAALKALRLAQERLEINSMDHDEDEALDMIRAVLKGEGDE